jgi:cytochrome c-type biogenesis protein
MIALEGNFAYSFILGVLAAVNPCGFVLLPTYLMYFLGLEGSRPDSTQRASLIRALKVSAAVSGGFIAVFLVVGIITRAFTSAIADNAKYAGFVVGIALIIMGVAMLFGWKPMITTPQITAKRDNTVRAMFIFGIGYAVASIVCTIGFLTTVILSSVGRHGYVSGVTSIVLYGAGMGLLVSSLTVTLALAKGGLLRVLRNGLKYMDRIAAVFVFFTGVYLTWYWYGAISNRATADRITARIERWQSDIATFLQGQGAWRLAIVFTLVIALAVVIIYATRRSNSQQSTSIAAEQSQDELV